VRPPLPVSVVIPTLDEEDYIAGAIRSVRGSAEVLVVDGGSTDQTRDRAAEEGARVLTSPRGRGQQLDLGAREATGDWIVFLHADTRLEGGWAEALAALGREVVGGAFRFAVDSPRSVYRWVEKAVELRCRLFALPFGDQAIFARRHVYGMVGGFPPFPLMEDLHFVRRLSRAGPMALLRTRAFTSARRWETNGVVTTTARNLWLLGLYAAGRAPERLARFYGAPHA
jgi:rSAM/selenodomain-associated transferase 2